MVRVQQGDLKELFPCVEQLPDARHTECLGYCRVGVLLMCGGRARMCRVVVASVRLGSR